MLGRSPTSLPLPRIKLTIAKLHIVHLSTQSIDVLKRARQRRGAEAGRIYE